MSGRKPKIDFTNWGRKRTNPPKQYAQNYRIPGQDRPPTARQMAIEAADFAQAAHIARSRAPPKASCEAPCSKPSAGPSKGAAAAPCARPPPAGARRPSGGPPPRGARPPSGPSRRTPARAPSPPPRQPSPSPPRRQVRSPSPPPSPEPTPSPPRRQPSRPPRRERSPSPRAQLSNVEELEDDDELPPPRQRSTQRAQVSPRRPRRPWESSIAISPPKALADQQAYIQRVLQGAQDFRRWQEERAAAEPEESAAAQVESAVAQVETALSPVVALPVQVVLAEEDLLEDTLFDEALPDDFEPPEPEDRAVALRRQIKDTYRLLMDKVREEGLVPFLPPNEPLESEEGVVVAVAAVDGDHTHPTRIVVPASAALSPDDVVVAVPRAGGVARMVDYAGAEEQPLGRVPVRELLRSVSTADLRRELQRRKSGRTSQRRTQVANTADYLINFGGEMAPVMYDSEEDGVIESDCDLQYANQVMPEPARRGAVARVPEYDFFSQSTDDVRFLQPPLNPRYLEPSSQARYGDTSETLIEDYERPSEELYRLVKLFSVP